MIWKEKHLEKEPELLRGNALSCQESKCDSVTPRGMHGALPRLGYVNPRQPIAHSGARPSLLVSDEEGDMRE